MYQKGETESFSIAILFCILVLRGIFQGICLHILLLTWKVPEVSTLDISDLLNLSACLVSPLTHEGNHVSPGKPTLSPDNILHRN